MRVPRPGVGKSRLAAGLGVADTHLLAQAFVADSARLATLGQWGALAAFTPASEREAAAAILPDARLVPQVEGDLGARILGALGAALEDGERAVLIGSDTPDLPRALIDQAFARLDDCEVVIAPAVDGGFVLIGVRAAPPALFDGVEWSTDSVCARVVANVEALGWRVALLDVWEDVDDLASLAALERRIEASDAAPATRAALDELRISAGRRA
ncbi:MAG: TIGR04282 family arsenosugar biosynthesis glycosyltransferase [Chloroflexota bacterium]